MNGIPLSSSSTSLSSAAAAAAALAAAARTDAALALATDELARLRLMTHSPHQQAGVHHYNPYATLAADNSRKVAPMVPPKPRKSAGGEDVPFQPNTLPRKDPPAYHEPHIFEPTPAQYYCLSSNGEKSSPSSAAAPQVPIAAPQQHPKAMPQVCNLHPASSTIVVGTTGARFGLAVSRVATSGNNFPPPPPPPLPPPNPPQPPTLHKAEPMRVQSNGYGVASGVATKAAPMAPSVCRQCPGVAHGHLPPNYADSSNYSCTDYSNSANYGNSSNYSNFSNYADYENINSSASVASYSSFNEEDLPPPPPPEPPSMYSTNSGPVVGSVCNNGHRSSVASVYSTATPPPPPPPPPPLSVASGGPGDDCASCCSYGHLRSNHHQHQHQHQHQLMRNQQQQHYGHNYSYQSPPSPAPSAASAGTTSSSAYAELRRVAPLMVPPPPPYPSTSATTGTGMNSSPAPSVAGSVYGGSGHQYRSGSRMQDGQGIYDPTNGSRAGSRLSGYSGGYGVLPGSHLGPSGMTPRANGVPSGSMTSLSTLSAMSGLGGSKLSLGGSSHLQQPDGSKKNEVTVDALTDLLVQSMNSSSDPDFFGMCQKCGTKVVGEGNGCTAMDNVYHVQCFRCSCCDKQLEGKPFYAVEAKPYCDQCYLETLEKCSVCVKPIMDRILRATGKPYHPKCFCCIICGKCLDGIPFTVDAHNRIHCIEDFHKKFAPRCSVCKEPIMPEPGEEETVRVVALDRSFHVKCYRCEDCGLALSSEAEGRGCYPLDGHVLCKSCNAKRVQALSSPKLRGS